MATAALSPPVSYSKAVSAAGSTQPVPVTPATSRLARWKPPARSRSSTEAARDSAGTTASYAKELVRRAVLIAADPEGFVGACDAALAMAADPEGWLAGTTRHQGTWWSDWADWARARSGEERPAPTSLGSKRHQPIEAAPGLYVREQ